MGEKGDNMYTLFIDTHDELITISFVKDNEAFTKEIESESHSIHLLPLLDEMLKEKNKSSETDPDDNN